MIRFLLVSAAQSGRPDPGCPRDVSRFCQVQMDQGDMVILDVSSKTTPG
jgi:hypothetical protein